MTSTSLDKLRDDVIELKTDFDKLYRQVIQITTNLEEHLANASNEKETWQDIAVKLAIISHEGMIILNVGGDKYTTSVETLTCKNDTFFTVLFSKQWELKRDPLDKSIFIDRNGKLFHYILEYLRTDTVSCDAMENESLRRSLIIESKYFSLHDLVDILTEPDKIVERTRKEVEQKRQEEESERFRIDNTFLNGTLLEREQKLTLNQFYGNRNQRWKLIYKASHDGFDANAFHTRCDAKGPTMTIVRSNSNYLFGGYTSVAWTSDNGEWKNDTSQFLFTLTNPHNIPPTKYPINPVQVQYTVFHNSAYGPMFGGGQDLRLVANSNSSNSSFTAFPTSYIDTTGKGRDTFTGTYNFTAADIEVFQLAKHSSCVHF